MDVKIVDPFIHATVMVLETMAHAKVNPGKPYVNLIMSRVNTALKDREDD